MIDVSGMVGEVRRIGIRATVIRTPDGSEVIIPNGTLILTQVTNRTLSDQQRAIEVPVTVVRGNRSAEGGRTTKNMPDTARNRHSQSLIYIVPRSHLPTKCRCAHSGGVNFRSACLAESHSSQRK